MRTGGEIWGKMVSSAGRAWQKTVKRIFLFPVVTSWSSPIPFLCNSGIIIWNVLTSWTRFADFINNNFYPGATSVLCNLTLWSDNSILMLIVSKISKNEQKPIQVIIALGTVQSWEAGGRDEGRMLLPVSPLDVGASLWRFWRIWTHCVNQLRDDHWHWTLPDYDTLCMLCSGVKLSNTEIPKDQENR